MEKENASIIQEPKPTFLKRLNGHLSIAALVLNLIIIGVFFWTFCAVRDFPATFVTKAEAQIQYENIKKEQARQQEQYDKQLTRIYQELSQINIYLREAGK